MIEGLTAEKLAADFSAVAELVHDVEHPAPGATTQAGRQTRQVPASRLPPGVQVILDADATTSALSAAYALSAYVAGVISERCGEMLRPSSIDGAQALVDMTYDTEGRYIVYAICGDLEDVREALRSVVRRYQRVVQTGRPCFDYGCRGRYVVPSTDGDLLVPLRCDGCGDVVPYSTWREWPLLTPEWVTPEQAAQRLTKRPDRPVTVAAVKMRASREQWTRRRTGREVQYHVDSVDRSGRPERVEGSAA